MLNVLNTNAMKGTYIIGCADNAVNKEHTFNFFSGGKL